MPTLDLKLIAELLTAAATFITALIAAVKAAKAKEFSDQANRTLGQVQTTVLAVLNQTQTIAQNLTHVQQTVNVFPQSSAETRGDAGIIVEPLRVLPLEAEMRTGEEPTQRT